jgi:hypothetical protein
LFTSGYFQLNSGFSKPVVKGESGKTQVMRGPADIPFARSDFIIERSAK